MSKTNWIEEKTRCKNTKPKISQEITSYLSDFGLVQNTVEYEETAKCNKRNR